MTTKNVSEIFEEFEQRSTKADRLAVLRFNENFALRSILKGAFDPNVEFFTDKVPDYKPSDLPTGLGYSNLSQELNRVYLLEKNNPKTPPTLTSKRREEIMIQMFESLEAKEAKILEGMITKKLKVKGLNYALVKEAFPNLLP